MRKTVAAVSIGLLLIAGNAVAAGVTANTQVNDRVGARTTDESSELIAGVAVIPVVTAIVATVAFVAVVSEDNSESGN